VPTDEKHASASAWG